jgi:hypothetical protein
MDTPILDHTSDQNLIENKVDCSQYDQELTCSLKDLIEVLEI